MIFSNMPFEYLILFILSAVIAIVLHECAHGLVAKWNGDFTAKYHGRISLNPVKHFDLFGFIMLMTAGFGFAKPVPVNPAYFRNRRKGIFLVSIAGIATNLILALIAACFAAMIEKFAFGGSQNMSQGAQVMTYVFYYFFYFLVLINVNLAIFNLLPIFPLDGYRILESVTGPMNKITKALRDYGPYLLIILVLIGVFFGFLVRAFPSLPAWLDPLGFLIEKVGGGFSNCLLNLWRIIFANSAAVIW